MSQSIRNEHDPTSIQSGQTMVRHSSASKPSEQRSLRFNGTRKLGLSGGTMTSPMSGPISETLTGTTNSHVFEPILQ